MSNYQDPDVTLDQVRAFLHGYLGEDPGNVALVGEGAWSRCFGFEHGGEDLVIRCGRYGEDFEKDRRATAYAAPGLPVPEVRDVGRALDGYYAISTRVYGEPLEEVSAATWRAVVPSVADMLEALRLAPLPPEAGAGGWDAQERTSHETWSDFLLAIADEAPQGRTRGWRALLAEHPAEAEAFRWGVARLREVADVPVPIGLIHGDLLNRNVLVDDSRISGVFDWGCSLYGDPLYDVAWFEFWQPWHPQLDVELLWAELRRRWRAQGHPPQHEQARLQACYLRMALDNMAYNAYRTNWQMAGETAERMRQLVP
jgi:hygromycin-B 4-O-kinase